jgi:hypothetical protein
MWYLLQTTAATLAAMLLLSLTPASAQPAPATAQVDVGAASVGAATQHLQRLSGDKRFLTIGDTEAQVIDPATLAIERRITFDQLDWTPRQDGRDADPLLLRTQGATRTVIDPLSGEPFPLLQGELLLLSAVDRDGIAVTQTKDETRIIIKRLGAADTITTLERPAAKATAKSPKVSISDNGKRLAVVWNEVVQVVDLTSGSTRRVTAKQGTAAVLHTTFTADDSALILVTETGPFDVRDVTTLDASSRITVPTINRRFSATSHRGGSVMELEGRRQRVVFDTKTGKHITAERMSSGSGFLLRFVEPDLVLRASAYRMGKGSAYGLYRHDRGDFKLLHRTIADGLALGTLALSPNNKCLFAVAKSGAKLADTATGRTLATAPDAAAVTRAQFTSGGDALIATDDAGRLLRITAPTACRATAARQN